MNIKVSNALANDGDISLENVLDLDREYGKTVRFWEIRNFKYSGTQEEAACLSKAFGNEELQNTYANQQEFLEHIVELKAAQTENRNNMILNGVATILALIQIQPYAVELLASFYSNLGIDVTYADHTFNTGILGGTLTVLIILLILRRRNRRLQQHNMRV
jgi:hypothetical protein